ncbi:MAG: VirB4 family type IV secretion/conjugal transfer ATPase, partial [Novosphingobium sp.]
MGKWTGAALWSKKEATAGERLPYRGFVDENVIQLRDGSLMMALLVPGLSFETADADELNAHTAAREVLLRSALDARFVLYHHVIRRRVNLSLEGRFDDPLAAHIDALWRDRLSRGALFVNDQFITLVRRPARGKAGWAERFGKLVKRRSADDAADPAELRALRTTASGMLAALSPYGARLLGDYDGGAGTCSELLELLSALYNGEMRPVRRPAEGVDLGAMLPYQRLNFGLDALELRGAGKATFGALLSLKDYPDSTSPGLTDGLLRLPCEMVLTETYAPADRQIARERIDLAIRRLRSADEEAMAERREMQAARDALGVGAVGFGDHHLSVLVRSDHLAAL